MPCNVTRLTEGPIIVVEVINPFNFESDMHLMFSQTAEAANAVEGKFFLIYDVRHLLMDFSELVQGIGRQRLGEPGSMTDPRALPIVVANSEVARLGTESMSQPQYGGVKIPFFEDLEAALAYIRTQPDYEAYQIAHTLA